MSHILILFDYEKQERMSAYSIDPIQVTFVVEAGGVVGFGHLKRCLIIANAMHERGMTVCFLLGDLSGAGEELIKKSGFRCNLFSQENYSQLSTLVKNDASDHSKGIVLFDVSHSGLERNIQPLEKCLKQLCTASFTVGLIDSSGAQSLRAYMAEINVDLLIAPYVGEKKVADSCVKELLGPKYFVIDPSYSTAFEKRISDRSNRIVVTCGGADPTEISLLILKSLDLVSDRKLDVRVIAGPFFSKKLVREIVCCADSISHNIEFVDAPESLADSMRWCDVAISTSGLTKYELAATGTPALLISIDVIHEEINGAFNAEGCSSDIGIGKYLGESDVSSELISLLDDYDRRRMMSEKGSNLIDGMGTERIIDALIRSSSAKING